MSKRRNSPGCYCCDNETGPTCPTACCTSEEVFPTISAGEDWGLRTRTVSPDCCCVTAVFDYATDDPVYECCDLAGTYAYEVKGVRNDYGWKKWQAIVDVETACGPGECLDGCCLPTEPELISTWEDTVNDEFNYYFSVRFFFESLHVNWGREYIDCPGDAEPQCRYFLKTTIYGRYEAGIYMHQYTTSKRELTYLHPCYEYRPDVPSLCPQLASSITCEFDNVIFDTCPSPDEMCVFPLSEDCINNMQTDSSPSECFYKSETFCVERIKYFDEPPPTSVSFSDTDILTPPAGDPAEYCEEPQCSASCNNGYVTSVQVNSGVPAAPFWYTNPPTTVSTTTTYLIDFNFCSRYPTVSGPVNCCDNPIVYSSKFCPAETCTTPTISVNVTCEDFPTDFREDWVDDPAQCRLETRWLFSTSSTGTVPGGPGSGPHSIYSGPIDFNGIGCYFPESGPFELANINCDYWTGNCILPIAATGQPCNSDCYATQTCDCFCRCVPLFPMMAMFSSNTMDFSSTGSWTEKTCEYTGFNLTISLNYGP